MVEEILPRASIPSERIREADTNGFGGLAYDLEYFGMYAPGQPDIALDPGLQFMEVDAKILHARPELLDTLLETGVGSAARGKGAKSETHTAPTQLTQRLAGPRCAQHVSTPDPGLERIGSRGLTISRPDEEQRKDD